MCLCLLRIDRVLLSHHASLAAVEARGQIAGLCESMPWTLDVTRSPKWSPGLATPDVPTQSGL